MVKFLVILLVLVYLALTIAYGIEQDYKLSSGCLGLAAVSAVLFL